MDTTTPTPSFSFNFKPSKEGIVHALNKRAGADELIAMAVIAVVAYGGKTVWDHTGGKFLLDRKLRKAYEAGGVAAVRRVLLDDRIAVDSAHAHDLAEDFVRGLAAAPKKNRKTADNADDGFSAETVS